MKTRLKNALYLFTLLSVTLMRTACFAQTYDQNKAPAPQNSESSQNWANNPQKWQNRPDNWKNSPQNWDNSGSNYNSTNGIYDSNGNRIGYIVPSADGGINYFNNDGSRRGYQPGH
jgi:hypothetical protein